MKPDGSLKFILTMVHIKSIGGIRTEELIEHLTNTDDAAFNLAYKFVPRCWGGKARQSLQEIFNKVKIERQKKNGT